MGAVWVHLRAEIRLHRSSWLALVVVVGLGSGAVLGIAAGARRTDSAYSRFVRDEAPSDFLIGGGYVAIGQTIDPKAIAHFPDVQSTAVAAYLPAVGRTSSGQTFLPFEAAPGAAADPQYGTTLDRWKLLAGRRPRPQSLDEAVASFEFARRFDVGVGDTVQLSFLPITTADRLLPQFLAGLPGRVAGNTSSLKLDALFDSPPVTVRVVGIEAAQFEFPPLGLVLPSLGMTQAFYEKYAAGLVREDIIHVKLRPGANPVVFTQMVDRLNGGHLPATFEASSEVTPEVQRSIHLGAIVLWVLAGLVGLTVAVTLGQAFARQAEVESEAFPVLGALGMTPRQLVVGGTIRAGATGAVGAVLAVAIAVAMSPIWPLGLARDAEPSPGLSADWTVFFIGAVLIVLFSSAAGGWATARFAATGPRSGRSDSPGQTRASTFGGQAIFPITVGIGVRHAFQHGRGAAAVPLRSAMVMTSLAVGIVVIAATFAVSTHALLVTPRLYGWTSAAEIHTQTVPGAPVAAGLAENPGIAGVVSGTETPLQVGGVSVETLALDEIHGTVRPDLTAGHGIRGDRDIILGNRTATQIGATIGSDVSVSLGSRRTRMRVVGLAVFAQSGDAVGQVDEGAQIRFSALRRLSPGAAVNLIRFTVAPGANAAAVVAQVRNGVAPLQLFPPAPPTTITSFGETNDLPAIVAGIMGVLAIAALTHAMVSSWRRRRRDFTILEALGYVRRQRAETVSATATTCAAVSLAVGIPFGLVVGRWAWSAVAEALGIPSEPTLNAWAVALIVAGLLIVANVIALLPWAATRRAVPADRFRVE